MTFLMLVKSSFFSFVHHYLSTYEMETIASI